MTIKNIIFDLGNVLIDFSPKVYLENYVSEEKRNDFYNTIFPTKEWLRLDDGTLSYEEAKVIFKSRIPHCSAEIDEFFDFRFYDMLLPIWRNIEVLSKISEQKKYKLYILSNFHKESIEELKKRYRFFDIFDDEVISCYCHLLKPDDSIYEYLIEKFNIDAEDTIFIDDTELNIIASEKNGIKGIHLPDYSELSNKLKDFGII